VIETWYYRKYVIQPFGCYKHTLETSYNIPLIPLNFLLKYWELIYVFCASSLNKYLMLWVDKYVIISFIPLWYILLFTFLFLDSNINFLFHLIFDLVYLSLLLSRARKTIFHRYSSTWKSLIIYETCFQSIIHSIVWPIGESLQ